MTGRLKVVVDRDLCDANGVCVMKAPAVFTIDDDDSMRLLLEYPPPEQIEHVQAAVQYCPKGALSLSED